MGEEGLRRVIEYIDSRIRMLEEEISLLKGLREIMEDKARRLSVEPSMEEVPRYYHPRSGGGATRAGRGSGASPTSCPGASSRN